MPVLVKIPGKNAYELARNGQLPEGQFDAEDMIFTVNKAGESVLYFATIGNKLDKIRGGVSPEQLVRAAAPDGRTALHYASDCVEQITGDFDADFLLNCKGTYYCSALHYWVRKGRILQVPGGVTVDQLLTRANNGATALQFLLESPNYSHDSTLLTVLGGVTVAHLAGTKIVSEGVVCEGDLLGIAAAKNMLHQIKGGVQASDFSISALHQALRTSTASIPDLSLADLQKKDPRGTSGINVLIANHRLDQYPVLTQEVLAADISADGETMLHVLAKSRSLHRIARGAFPEFLASTFNRKNEPVTKFADPNDMLLAEAAYGKRNTQTVPLSFA